MPNSDGQWNPDTYGDDGGTGLLWRTARNVAVLLAGCLLVLGVMKWDGEPVAGPRGGERERGVEGERGDLGGRPRLTKKKNVNKLRTTSMRRMCRG